MNGNTEITAADIALHNVKELAEQMKQLAQTVQTQNDLIRMLHTQVEQLKGRVLDLEVQGLKRP